VHVQARLLVVGGSVVLALALVAAAFLLRSSTGAEPGTTVASPAVARTTSPAFPSPPRGATVFARELGANALALAVVPQRGRVVLQASLVGPQGEGVANAAVRFLVHGATATASACGAGCYRATVGVAGRPSEIGVAVAGATWRVVLPSSWPPRDATALVARGARAWRALHSLAFTETLASSPAHRLTSSWRIQAPDRLTYTVKNGWSGVVVGAHRWDRGPGSSAWVESAQSPVTQPVPPWVAVEDAHLLGGGLLDGRPVWRVSFFDPTAHAWFTLALDRSTLRTVDLRMVATAHFMHDRYGAFDAAAPVEAP